MMFNPTVQQVDIVAESLKLKTFKVKARAGTGKTATAVLVADANGRYRIVYVVFNSDAAKDARGRMPENVDARTFHSLAHTGVIKQGPWNRRELVRSPFEIVIQIEDDGPLVAPVMELTHGEERSAAFAMVMTIVKWCNTDAQEMKVEHVPAGVLSRFHDRKDRARAGSIVAAAATKLWERICPTKSTLPITHDMYAKYWQLHDPKINADLIMLDESQDLSPVMLDVVNKQGVPVFAFGDDQQQIYAWRNAVNAMQALKGTTMPLTQSFRFGPEVAGMANEVLKLMGEEWLVEGVAPNGIIVDDYMDLRGEAVLCRGNAGVIHETLDSLDRGFRTAVCGGTTEAVKLLYACYDLFIGKPVKHPEIGIFKDWAEFKEFSETEDGAGYKPLVRLIERYGSGIRMICKRLQYDTEKNEKDAQVVVSTAHKAKGREWESVRLCDDFGGLVDAEVDESGNVKLKVKEEEANLTYVAITRAKKWLNMAGLGEQIHDDQASLNMEPGQIMTDLLKAKRDKGVIKYG